MNETNRREKRAAPLLAFGELTALTAGAGIACSVGSIFGGCGGSSRNRDNIDYALKKIEQKDYQWMGVKSDNEDKFFIVASQLKDIKSTEKRIINTQEKHAKALNGNSIKFS